MVLYFESREHLCDRLGGLVTCELLRQLDRLLMYYGLELREDQTLDTRASLYSLGYHGTVDFSVVGMGLVSAD